MVIEKPRICVLGSDGQVGKEMQVVAAEGYTDLDFYFLNRSDCDILNKEEVKRAFAQIKPDYTINAAAYTAVDKAEEEQELCYAVNAYALQIILHEVRGSKFFHISTDYVYDNDLRTPLKETDATSPKSIYAKSKLLGEKFVRASDVDYMILRTSWVYSSFNKNFVKTVLRLAEERDLLTIVDDQIGAPTYAYDIAKSIVNIISGDLNYQVTDDQWRQTYNYSNKGQISWYEFAKEIVSYLPNPASVNPIPSVLYPTPAPRPKWSVMDLDKISALKGVVLAPWKERLQKCIELLIN